MGKTSKRTKKFSARKLPTEIKRRKFSQKIQKSKEKKYGGSNGVKGDENHLEKVIQIKEEKDEPSIGEMGVDEFMDEGFWKELNVENDVDSEDSDEDENDLEENVKNEENLEEGNDSEEESSRKNIDEMESDDEIHEHKKELKKLKIDCKKLMKKLIHYVINCLL